MADEHWGVGCGEWLFAGAMLAGPMSRSAVFMLHLYSINTCGGLSALPIFIYMT